MLEDANIRGTPDQKRQVLRPSLLFVVEDSTDLSHLRNLFRRELLHVHFCSTIEDGLSVLSGNRVDLIVADVSDDWPRMLEFLRRAKEIRPEASRILLGVSTNEQEAMENVANGLAHRFLVKPWDDERLKSLVIEIVNLHHQERLRHLREKLRSFSSLPAPERFQTRLHQLLIKRDSSLAALVDEIEKSPSLIAKMLQVANSVQYWTRVPISTVRDAVVYIGTAHIASLVAAIEIYESISRGLRPDVHAHYELLWERSLRRAMLAKKIAEEWTEAGHPDIAYVTAMLQDVGLLVRLCNEHRRFLEMISIARNTQGALYQAELQIFSNTHDEVGALLLQFWNFPREIVFAVAHHHGNCFDDPLTQVIQIADALYSNDIANPHDKTLDPMVDIWQARLENSEMAKAFSHREF